MVTKVKKRGPEDKEPKEDVKKAKGKGKKGKGKVEEPPETDLQDEILLATTDLETDPEDIQFTDTSYTSASFETLPSLEVVVTDTKKKKKRKKLLVEESVEVEEDFDWSEEEPPPPEEEERKEAEEEEKEKPKKQKKGRGKKKKGDVDEIPDFPKPKNWKKMQKKERDKWLEEQTELWKIQKEAEKQAAIQEVKERRVREAKERVELTIRDQDEQEIRQNILRKTCNLFRKFETQKNDFLNAKQILAEWQQYLKCDGLPDPRIVTQMQTYLHKWQLLDACDDQELDKRANEVLPMLELLDVIMANSRLYTEQQLRLYDEVRRSLRESFSEAIEKASYYLIRNIEKNLTLESIKLATYTREFKGLRLNLWVVVRQPTRKPSEEEPQPQPVELSFPSMQVTVKLPTSIDSSCLCVRAARSMIDLLSESCRSYATPIDISNRFMDLYTFNVEEHTAVYALKAEQDEIRTKFYKEINAKIKEIEKTIKENIYAKNKEMEEELDRLYLMEPTPPLPDPRTFIGENNETDFRKYLKKCIYAMRKYEVNLRKYRICGGILHMDLLMTPPQPKRMQGEIEITTLSLPKKLQSISYQVQYRAPKPPGPETIRTPEEIEEQMRIVEAEYEKLALVTIDLPVDIMWMEPPTVCQWQETNKLWTSKYINDFKYNEDKFTIQFRTGVLWPIGLAVAKYTNLPFVSWDIRPDPNSKGVLLTVNGQIVAITWLCHGHFVRLKRISHNPTSALESFINHKMSVKQMVQVMREAACDFFPDFDAHNYTQETHHKEWVLERHTYHAMAFLSRAYNFQFSRWNSTAGSRNIVVQLREAVDKKREGRLQLIHMNPQRTTLLKCTENVTNFTLEPLVGMELESTEEISGESNVTTEVEKYSFKKSSGIAKEDTTRTKGRDKTTENIFAKTHDDEDETSTSDDDDYSIFKIRKNIKKLEQSSEILQKNEDM